MNQQPDDAAGLNLGFIIGALGDAVIAGGLAKDIRAYRHKPQRFPDYRIESGSIILTSNLLGLLQLIGMVDQILDHLGNCLGGGLYSADQ